MWKSTTLPHVILMCGKVVLFPPCDMCGKEYSLPPCDSYGSKVVLFPPCDMCGKEYDFTRVRFLCVVKSYSFHHVTCVEKYDFTTV